MLNFKGFKSRKNDQPLTIKEVKDGLELLADIFADVSDEVPIDPDQVHIMCINEVSREGRLVRARTIYLKDIDQPNVPDGTVYNSDYYTGPFFSLITSFDVNRSDSFKEKEEVKRIIGECLQMIERVKSEGFELYEGKMNVHESVFGLFNGLGEQAKHIYVKDIKSMKDVDVKLRRIDGGFERLTLTASFQKK